MATIYQMYERNLKIPQDEKCLDFAYMTHTLLLG